MFSMTLNDVYLTMAGCIFAMGIVSLGIGMVILVTRVLSEDFRTISNQIYELTEKGITEEISGLVGNAALLVQSLNKMIETAKGIGLTLMLVGLSMCGISYVLMLQIH